MEPALAGPTDAPSFVTVSHAVTPDVAVYFATSALELADASGEVTPEAVGFEVRSDVVRGALRERGQSSAVTMSSW